MIGISELVLAIGGKRLAESQLKDLLKAYEPQQQTRSPRPRPPRNRDRVQAETADVDSPPAHSSDEPATPR